MEFAVLARRFALAIVVCLFALTACGEKKDKKKKAEGEEAPAEVQPPDKERSFLASGCDEHGDAAKKAHCLCRVDIVDAELGEELLAKLETAPKDGPTEAVVEHVGGVANLSKVASAMRKASAECGNGGSK